MSEDEVKALDEKLAETEAMLYQIPIATGFTDDGRPVRFNTTKDIFKNE